MRVLTTPTEYLVAAFESRFSQRPGLRLRTCLFTRKVHVSSFHKQVSAGPQRTPNTPFDKFLSEFRRDRQVDTPFVKIKLSDGSLSEPKPLRSLLAEIDRAQDTVVQLSKPGTQTEAVVEICKLSQLREQFREKQETIKKAESIQREKKPKQIELNWAIGEHDLELKLKQLEQFLNKGKRVELIMAPKRHARKATLQEAQTLLKKIREKLIEIDAKEILPLEGEILRQALMVVKKKEQS